MIRKLHPTLKLCKCGYISDRNSLYRHLDQVRSHYTRCGMSADEFWADHGELPLNDDDERLTNLEPLLSAALTREQKLELL